MQATTSFADAENAVQAIKLSASAQTGNFHADRDVALSFTNVGVAFGAHTCAGRLLARILRQPVDARFSLSDVTFTLFQGEWATLVGSNASGKTTILKLAQGLYEPHTGQIVRALPVVQVFGESRSFYARLTIEENLQYFNGLRGIDASNIVAQLKRVALYEDRDLPVRQASTGMCARLGLARALCACSGPTLLLLDEPERGLDAAGLSLLADVLRENSAQGGAALIATHASEAAWLKDARRFQVGGGTLVEHACAVQKQAAASVDMQGCGC